MAKVVVDFSNYESITEVIEIFEFLSTAVAFAKFASVIVPELGEKVILLQVTESFSINAAQITGIISILVLTLINQAGMKYGKAIIS